MPIEKITVALSHLVAINSDLINCMITMRDEKMLSSADMNQRLIRSISANANVAKMVDQLVDDLRTG